MTSPMGKRISIRTPSEAVAVLRQTNGGAAEAMGTRTKSLLRCSIRRRWQRRKRYTRRHKSRRRAGSRTSCQRQRIFLSSPMISADTAAVGGTCTGPLYRCNGSGWYMEGQECNTRQNIHAINNGGSTLCRRQVKRHSRRRGLKVKLAQIVRK